jgi:hypothetical protein
MRTVAYNDDDRHPKTMKCNQAYDRIHLCHDCHTEFVDAPIDRSENTGGGIVAVAFVDVCVFKNDCFRSIGLHRQHLLQRGDKSDDGHGIFRSANNTCRKSIDNSVAAHTRWKNVSAYLAIQRLRVVRDHLADQVNLEAQEDRA